MFDSRIETIKCKTNSWGCNLVLWWFLAMWFYVGYSIFWVNFRWWGLAAWMLIGVGVRWMPTIGIVEFVDD